MRFPVPAVAAISLLAACAASADPAPAPPAAAPMAQHYDIPAGSAPQHVEMMTRDVPAGGTVPWHTHPGVEIAYLEFGRMELDMAGEAPRVLGPGDSFMAPRGVVHGGRNLGPGTARLVITYVVDKEAPLRLPAAAPQGY